MKIGSVAFGLVLSLCAAGWLWRTSDSSVPSVRAVAVAKVEQPTNPVPTQPSNSHVAPELAKGPTFGTQVLALWSMDGEQLLTAYRRGLASKEIEDKYLAYRALDICISTLIPSPRAEIGGTNGDTIRRADAARHDLRKKCAPFLVLPRDELQRNARSLLATIEGPTSPFRGEFLTLAPDDPSIGNDLVRQRLHNAITDHGGGALQWAGPALADWLAQPSTMLPKSQEHLRLSQHLHEAVTLARCELGMDCGHSSNALLVTCAVYSSCADSYEDVVLASLPSTQEQEAVRAQAKLIAKAVRTKQLHLLGL